MNTLFSELIDIKENRIIDVDYEFSAKKETGNRIYIVNEYSNNKK